MEVLLGKHWHGLPEEETLDILETNRDSGLDMFEVKHRQERMGPNVIRGKKEKSQLERFLLQFHQPLIYILIVAGIVTAILHEWVDSGVIFAVIVLNAIIGFLQESKAIKAIEALAQTMTAEATVLRSGEKSRIPSPEIVPGDIVFLQSGDKVPADLRIFQCRELQVDESVLTGESLPSRGGSIIPWRPRKVNPDTISSCPRFFCPGFPSNLAKAKTRNPLAAMRSISEIMAALSNSTSWPEEFIVEIHFSRITSTAPFK